MLDHAVVLNNVRRLAWEAKVHRRSIPDIAVRARAAVRGIDVNPQTMSERQRELLSEVLEEVEALENKLGVPILPSNCHKRIVFLEY